MPPLAAIDWKAVFLPGVPIVETIVRGTVVYLAVIALLRVVLRREAGLSLTDVLMVVLLGDASQNAMASNHTSVFDGLVLVMTILFWNYAIDWLGYRVPLVERLIHPRPLPLVKDGQMLRRNMRRELITEGELMNQVRADGIESLSDVKAAYMEGDGRISVVRRE